jgi:hypothetical protein
MLAFSRRHTMRAVAALAAGAALVAASRPTAAEPAALAIKGYDPVAYFVDGRPIRGLPEIEYEWDERRYRFSSAQHRDLFRADPVRYAPQFANFCAMSLAHGELVEADPESWLINADKLYIFGKREGPELFRQNLARNIVEANQNRPLIKGR